ncbi:beta-galactosidase trimerization domain-containing protein, partial [Lactiplantibacillus plantarum]
LADLEATYGIKVQETDTLYPQQHNALTAYHQACQVNDYCDVVETTTAQVLGTYQKDFYAGTPAVTVNQLGQGAAYYLAARTATDFLDAFYERLATSLALKPALPVIKANAKVSIQVRENATTRYYFVI